MTGEKLTAEARARLIAFYLPQFHPIPENDEWWGAGFTEWTNVAKAKPLFDNHWQPRLPKDLGFYDLRVPEVRQKQAELARDAGIEAFCYWHYWFGHGRRILERPFQEVLETGDPDFPFCLAWANQSWTGIWHGSPGQVLIEQKYPGEEDEKQHFEHVLPAFQDRRYLRVDGKPLFVLLDPQDHPRPGAFMQHWRMLAERAGLSGIYFVGMTNRWPHADLDEFDALTCYGPGDFVESRPNHRIKRWLRNALRGDFGERGARILGQRFRHPRRFDYQDVVDSAFSYDTAKDERYLPTVLPNWDNTPRSGLRGVVFENSSPERFSAWLTRAIARVESRPKQERIVFLKAWNEWAEGNYVEPDTVFGHDYLTAINKCVY